jgi:CRP-like cAMP-binding protein
MSKKINIVGCEDCPSLGESIFCNLKREILEEVSSQKGGNLYKKGEIVFSEGFKPFGIHCVSKGRIKIYKLGDDGKDQIVRVAKVGDIIGYRSLISDEIYSASAEALEDSRTCFIPKNTFFELIKQENEFALKIMKVLSKDLRKAESQSINIAQRTVKERLANALLSKRDIIEEKEGKELMSFTISRKDLADLIGCAPETLIRMLSQLKKEGVISLNKREVEILNHVKLYKLAHKYS